MLRPPDGVFASKLTHKQNVTPVSFLTRKSRAQESSTPKRSRRLGLLMLDPSACALCFLKVPEIKPQKRVVGALSPVNSKPDLSELKIRSPNEIPTARQPG